MIPVEDPGPPYLLFDCFPFDRGPLPDFDAAESTDTDGDGNPNVVGGILKATDGVSYGYASWFVANWKRISGLRGAYHYLQFFEDPIKQAEFYLRTLKLAGADKFEHLCIMPIVDVEFGGERAMNRRATKNQIIECTTRYANTITASTGMPVMLYGRGVMRDLGIVDKMGCRAVWNPAYTETMTMHGLEAWTRDEVVMWQYSGDGSSAFKKLPSSIHGLGKIDLSVAIDGDRVPTWQRTVSRLCTGVDGT